MTDCNEDMKLLGEQVELKAGDLLFSFVSNSSLLLQSRKIHSENNKIEIEIKYLTEYLGKKVTSLQVYTEGKVEIE